MKLNLSFFKPSATVIEQWDVMRVHSEHKNHNNEVVFIDVREANEWASGIIPGAKTIALSNFPAQLSHLDKDKQYILVCRSGNRSQMAAKMMEKAGFSALANFSGGMMAWQRQGFPTV